MSSLLHHASLSAPLFLLVAAGYGAMRIGRWPQAVSEALSRFVFTLALPALLFHMLSDFSALPPVDARLLVAFFGGCLAVFALGRLLAAGVFRLDGVSQSVFALGGVFSNNVMLGLPLAKLMLGDAALPSVALVLVFNALILWTLVTVSVEWARHGSLSLAGFGRTAQSVLTNPIVAAILLGTLWGTTGWHLPDMVNATLEMMGQSAAPMALVALGMGLSEYGLGKDWRLSTAITTLKLVAHPVAVWGLAQLLGLPRMETQVVTLLASIAVGVNVYLVSRQFRAMEGAVAGSLVLSTALAAVTTPFVVTALASLA